MGAVLNYDLCWCLPVSPFVSFSVICSSSNTYFIHQFPLCLCQILLLPTYPGGTACTVQRWRGWGWGGGVWVVWSHSLICVQSSSCSRFNMPTRFLIMDPSPATYTSAYWGVKLRISYTGKIMYHLFLLYCLCNPLLIV